MQLIRVIRVKSEGDAWLARSSSPSARGPRPLITASGLADVEFAFELFNELGVLSESDRVLWLDLFRSGRLPREVA